MRRWISGCHACTLCIAFRPVAKPLRCKTVHRTVLRALSRIPSLQQKTAPWGRFFWRRERDSNPRYHSWYTRFPVVRLRPSSAISARRLLHLCYITTNDSKKQDIFSCSGNIFQKPLAFSEKACIIISVRGALAQLVARNVRNVEVRSSNLLCSTRKGFVSANPFVLC